MNVYLDIETLPSDLDADREEIARKIAPPRTLKKAESIAAWERDDKPALIEDAMRATSLDGTYGRILAVGWAIDDGPVAAAIWKDNTDALTQERTVLLDFFERLREMAIYHAHGGEIDAEPCYIGHNITGFDLRFIWQRAAILGISKSMPASLRRAAHLRPWNSGVVDTMTYWNPERDRRISLDRLCRVLGLPSRKGLLNGAMVADAWQAGMRLELLDYVSGDVEDTRAVYKRLAGLA